MLGPVDLPRFGWLHRRLGALRAAFLAERDSAEIADDADEGAAVRARVAFGRALLVTAGAAHHQIPFAQLVLCHQTCGLKLIKSGVNPLSDDSLTV
jgi:hypothetical protein